MDGKLFKDKAFVFLNKLDTGDVRLLHEGTTRDGQLHVGIYRTFLGDEESNTTYHVLTTPNNDNPDSRIAYSTARENANATPPANYALDWQA